MLWLVYSLTALVIVSCLIILSLLLWKIQLQNSKLLLMQHQEIIRQNNLLASKDLTTFSTIQTLTANNTPVDNYNYVPLDDASVANAIAKQYQDAGIDPKSAYDSPDDAINDFGGPNAFI